MSQQSWDYIAKIVSLGDSACGKSSLTIRLCEGRFSPYHDVTIGVEFGSRIVPVGPPASLTLGINNGKTSAPATSHDATIKSVAEEQNVQKHMKLSLWDTAGQETYKSITRSYFRGASGALLVFDITRRATFTHVTEWLADLRQIAEEGIIVVLVGNKADLAPASAVSNVTSEATSTDTPSVSSAQAEPVNQRQVTKAEAEEWCRANNVLAYVETSAKNGTGVERAFLEVAERIHQNIEAGKYDLNDRRSGVKGPGTSVGNSARTVNLGISDGGQKRSSARNCC